MSKSKTPKPGSQQQVVRCVFGATITTGNFKGDMYECGAKAVGDYYDKLYKCRRPVCKRHANVVLHNDAKWKRNSDVRFTASND